MKMRKGCFEVHDRRPGDGGELKVRKRGRASKRSGGGDRRAEGQAERLL